MHFRFLLSSLVILYGSYCYSMEEEVPNNKNLFEAVWGGKIQEVTVLLSSPIDEKPHIIDTRYSNGCTLLTMATIMGHEDIVALLLSKGADFNAKDGEGKTALDHAVCCNRHGIVLMLLKADTSTFKLNNTLLKAAEEGNYQSAVEALDQGADPDGYSYILYISGYPIDKVRETWPLHQAMIHKHENLAELLISRKANVKGEAIDTATALGQIAVVKALLEAGAKPLNFLALLSTLRYSEPITTYKIMRLFCIYGAPSMSERDKSMSYRDTYQRIFPDPLEHAVVWYDAKELFELLKELQRTAQARCQSLATYYLTCLKTYWDPCSVKYPDPSVRYTQEEHVRLSNALMCAIGQGRKRMSERLLEFGADPYPALELAWVIALRDGIKPNSEQSQLYEALFKQAEQRILDLAQYDGLSVRSNYLHFLPREITQELTLFFLSKYAYTLLSAYV